MNGSAELRAFLYRVRVLLMVVFGVSLWGAYLIDTQGPRSFVVELRSEVIGSAQLFYDAGDGFTDAESITLPVGASNEYVTLRFSLPDKYIRSIRFDPISSPGTFSIRSAYVIDAAERTVRRFAASDWAAMNQIAARTEEASTVTFSTTADASDPALHLVPPAPMNALWLSRATWARLAVQTAIALLMTVAVAAAGFAFQGQLGWASQRLDRAASAISDSHVLVVDRFAMVCYVAIGLFFLVSVAAGFHGSSLSIHANPWIDQDFVRPLIGVGKDIRSDEWAAHTPAILNQVYRAKRFDPDWSVVGPDSASLLANIPVRHFTTIFRPQFWGFFVLPPAYGFAFYWQFKALLLLTGVFSLLLLLTHSSRIAAFATLWYASSAYVQWTYSWPSLLPEMVGLFCLVMCSLFYVSVGRRAPLLIGAALLCLASAVNFALCAYIPHQIPLVWLGAFLCGWWTWARRASIFTRHRAIPRAAALGGIALAIGVVMLGFYRDAEGAILTGANTVYPGQRSLTGGGYPITMLFSQFFAYWTDERTYPLRQAFGNICECSGFFWLAPAAAFCMRASNSDVYRRLAFGTLATFGALLFVWLTVPLPEVVGSLTFMNKSGVGRSLHVLGLVNVSLVAIALSLRQANPSREWRKTLTLGAAALATLYPIFALTNVSLASFLTAGQVLLAAAYVTVTIVTLVEGRLGALAVLLIAPQIFFFGLVNPLDRGLRSVESSPLFEFVQSRPELLRDRWIVYSDSFPDSSFFASVGCEVLTGLRYVPDLNGLNVFDLSSEQRSALNRSGIFVARPSYGADPVRFEAVTHYFVLWYVNPLDARLKQMGVRYAAFTAPPPAHIASQMRLLSTDLVQGFLLYALP